VGGPDQLTGQRTAATVKGWHGQQEDVPATDLELAMAWTRLGHTALPTEWWSVEHE